MNGSRLRRLGIPDLTGNRDFVSAVAIDAVGSGVFMPISLLYFIATTSLDAARVGLALSVAGLVSVPVVLSIGHIVDRFGARRILIIANAIQVCGFVSYLVVSDFAQVMVAMCVVSVGQTAFWASYSPLVAALSQQGERELWFGFLGALRNVGFALGGVLAGVAIAIGTRTAYHLVVVANAVSYAVAMVIYLRLRAGTRSQSTTERAPWSIAFRDRQFRVLVATNLVYALCAMALNVAMAVYAVDNLGLAGWIPGAIFTINTVMVGFGQGLVVRWMTGRRRYRLAILANIVTGFSFIAMAGVSTLSLGLATAAILLTVVIYTLGELIGGPVLSAIAVDSRPAHLRGRYMAFYQLSWVVSGIIAPASFTWLLGHGDASLWLVLAAVCAIGAVLCTRLPMALPVAAAPVTNAAAVQPSISVD